MYGNKYEIEIAYNTHYTFLKNVLKNLIISGSHRSWILLKMLCIMCCDLKIISEMLIFQCKMYSYKYIDKTVSIKINNN